jgi:hypothetical protein
VSKLLVEARCACPAACGTAGVSQRRVRRHSVSPSSFPRAPCAAPGVRLGRPQRRTLPNASAMAASTLRGCPLLTLLAGIASGHEPTEPKLRRRESPPAATHPLDTNLRA